jgi:hypothetical protein
MSFKLRTVVAACAICSAGAASAASLSITVTNNQGADGLSLTPLYTALHDGSFDAFNVGDSASPGVELIAETGMPGTVMAERLAADPGSVAEFITAGAPPPIQPGESSTVTIDVDPLSNRFLTFLAMVLPSNDTFIGNDDPTEFEIFDAMGNFLGPQSIEVTGLDVYDAGTEANALLGSAFVAGEDITLGGLEDEPISPVTVGRTDLSAFIGAALPDGRTLGADAVNGLLLDPGAVSLLTIDVDFIAPTPVPLPATAPLLLFGLGAVGLWSRRRKQAA